MREAFDRELRRLEEEVLRMGSEIEEHIVSVVDAFIRRDNYTAQRMINADAVINEQRIQVGLDSLTLIATQQPMAKDMRFIGAILEIVGELERIHDYVKGIGKISLNLGAQPLPQDLVRHMQEMAAIASNMLNQSIKAFAERNEELARTVPADDDQVDALFNEAYSDIIHHVTQNPDDIQLANQLEWAHHNLERTADRCINICEWVVYMVTGEYKEMSFGEYSSPPEATD
ncbi:MAG: phosphate signaling complex protein PhoU [Chloroflexota bacterium]